MIKTSDEGTSYCTQCEAWAKENAELKSAYDEASAIAKKWCERGKQIEKLEAVARAAEELASANGFIPGTAANTSLPLWIIARVNHLAEALKSLREGKP